MSQNHAATPDTGAVHTEERPADFSLGGLPPVTVPALSTADTRGQQPPPGILTSWGVSGTAAPPPRRGTPRPGSRLHRCPPGAEPPPGEKRPAVGPDGPAAADAPRSPGAAAPPSRGTVCPERPARGGGPMLRRLPPGSSEHIGRVAEHPRPVGSGPCPRTSPSASWPAQPRSSLNPDLPTRAPRSLGFSTERGRQQSPHACPRPRCAGRAHEPVILPARPDHHRDRPAHPAGAAWPVTKGAPATA